MDKLARLVQRPEQRPHGGRSLPAIGVAALLVAASLPPLVFGKVLYACQEGTLSNYWTMLGGVVSLAMIFLVVRLKLGLVA